MKLLRETIRQILLTEAAKVPTDLPEGYFITMRTEGSDWARWEIVKGATKYYNTAEHGDKVYGHMDIGKVHKDRYGNCLDAWMVRMSKASKGFGPMLYDIALEYSTQMGSGLISDRGGSTPAAKDVWNYYQDNRTDVEFVQLDNMQDSFNNGPQDDCAQDVSNNNFDEFFGGDQTGFIDSALSKMYKKSPASTIQELESLGILIRI
tara:strand:+ start:174 stop:791 length:618 start_codon:yes stop_codon:yes gene_type:complete